MRFSFQEWQVAALQCHELQPQTLLAVDVGRLDHNHLEVQGTYNWVPALHMTVSMIWGSFVLGVLVIQALVFGVCIMASDFWKLPCKPNCQVGYNDQHPQLPSETPQTQSNRDYEF